MCWLLLLLDLSLTGSGYVLYYLVLWLGRRGGILISKHLSLRMSPCNEWDAIHARRLHSARTPGMHISQTADWCVSHALHSGIATGSVGAESQQQQQYRQALAGMSSFSCSRHSVLPLQCASQVHITHVARWGLALQTSFLMSLAMFKTTVIMKGPAVAMALL